MTASGAETTPSAQFTLFVSSAKKCIYEWRKNARRFYQFTRLNMSSVKNHIPTPKEVATVTRQKCDVGIIRLQQGSKSLADRIHQFYLQKLHHSNNLNFGGSESTLVTGMPGEYFAESIAGSDMMAERMSSFRCASSLSVRSSCRPRGPRAPPMSGLHHPWIDVSSIPTRLSAHINQPALTLDDNVSQIARSYRSVVVYQAPTPKLEDFHILPLPPVKLLEFSGDESVEDLQGGIVYNETVDVVPDLNSGGELRVDVSSSIPESSDHPIDAENTDSDSISEVVSVDLAAAHVSEAAN